MTTDIILMSGGDVSNYRRPCPVCSAAIFSGFAFVALPIGDVAVVLCHTCARKVAPVLAAIAEALNTAYALSNGLTEFQSACLLGALSQLSEHVTDPGKETPAPAIVPLPHNPR